MEIPLENRAHVIATVDHDFIRSLSYIPPGTEKVYYEGFALKTPSWLTAEDAVRQLVEAEDSCLVERLELTPVDLFTPNIDDAMTFHCDEVYGEAAGLKLPGNPGLIIEDTGKEWYPF